MRDDVVRRGGVRGEGDEFFTSLVLQSLQYRYTYVQMAPLLTGLGLYVLAGQLLCQLRILEKFGVRALLEG